LTTRRPRSVQP